MEYQPRKLVVTKVSNVDSFWLLADFACLFCADEKPKVRDLLVSLEYGPAPESPAVAEAWLDDHGRSFGHFIGNRWVKPEGRKTYDSYNPATGQRLATTVQGTLRYKCALSLYDEAVV